MTLVFTPKEFLKDFIKTASQAKKRIYLQSMLFESGHFLHALEPVLLKKAAEGLDVRVTFDWVSQRYVHEEPNIILPLSKSKILYNKKIHLQSRVLAQKWADKGVKITMTNRPHLMYRILPIAGRNHSKMYLADDTAWVGGINLYDNALKHIDIMVKLIDKKLIHALSGQYFRVNQNKPKKNYSVSCGKTSELYVDAGIIGKSLIFQEAIKLIKNAKKTIVFASQFVPDNAILNQIEKAADNGVSVDIYTAHSGYRNYTKFPYNVPYLFFKKSVRKKPNIRLYHQPIKMHAKLLLIDNSVAFFGSHNFVNIGVMLGTEEIAVCVSDKELIRQIQEFIKKNLCKNTKDK